MTSTRYNLPVTQASRARGLVVAWMPVSQRSATLASRLGYELLLVGRPGFRSPLTAPFTYPVSAVRTIAAIVRRRPSAIIVAAPPIVAPLVALAAAPGIHSQLVIDVHSGALLDRRWRWSAKLLGWAGRRAGALVVTLPSLASQLEAMGCRVLVLPDPLPSLPSPASGMARTTGAPPRVVAICGWGDDEPIDEIVASARGRSWELIITGRPRRPVDRHGNVRLSGFLSTDAYQSLLATADAIVVLTTRADTLLSGAWEALALGCPLVTSDTQALRETFGDVPRYVRADPAEIGEAIEATLADPESAARVRRLALEHDAASDVGLSRLADILGATVIPVH